ncbi:MAG: hydroxymethylglutaryl-CoA reductase, degradative, partial [Bdellovibrionota bacterium]
MASKLEAQFKELFEGFSKLPREERLQRLEKMGALTREDVQYFMAGAPLSTALAENFIENVVGYFQMPMGIAANFVIDGKPYAIPMAVEETSIIAAASKTAKWIRETGKIRSEVVGKNIIGQIQIAKVKNFDALEKYIADNRERFIEIANRDVAQGMVVRGGGVRDVTLRRISREEVREEGTADNFGPSMAVIHVMMDPCEAMGANIINQVCEYLKTPIQSETGETVTMCILSNLVDTKLTRAEVIIPSHGREADLDLFKRIAEASLFAQLDPYRAATNNKGVLNGIDPILIATGNDWRAVEAGIHAYAARDGQYRSVTRWTVVDGHLHGVFEAPVILGTVGGVTRLHPMARIALRLLGVESADELSRVCAAVGLVQNLGALKALTTIGIIEGHMKLHIKNLTLGAGAEGQEIPYVQKRLEEILAMTKRITLSNAVDVLKEFRNRGLSKIGAGSGVPLKDA